MLQKYGRVKKLSKKHSKLGIDRTIYSVLGKNFLGEFRNRSLPKDALEEGAKILNRSPTSEIMTKKEIITALNDSESRLTFIFGALDKGILLR